MIYLDTGCLVKLYYPEPESAAVVRRVAGRPVFYTPLHELELTNALNQKRFHGQATEDQVAAALGLIQADLASGVLMAPASVWRTHFQSAVQLSMSLARHPSLRDRRRSPGGRVHHHRRQTESSGAGDGTELVAVVTRRIIPSASLPSTPAAHQTRR
jgi:predicted nucleic acid-binding protein